MTKIYLSSFAAVIILSGILCFLLDRKVFAGLRPWMKVPLYTILGSAVSFAMTFAIVDVLNYAVGLLQTSVSKPLVESAQQVLLVLAVSLAMGLAFGFTFGVLDVEDEDAYHIRMALLRDERYSEPVGCLLGAVAALRAGVHTAAGRLRHGGPRKDRVRRGHLRGCPGGAHAGR